MLYFRGCTARVRLNSISDSTQKLLNLANLDFVILDNEECCGSVLLRTGFEDEAKEQMEKNLANFKNNTILVSCAGCYKTLKKDYNDLLGVELDVIHISQLLRDLIKENKIIVPDKNIVDSSDKNIINSCDNDGDFNAKDDIGETVTYHDPCHLGRHMEEFDAPREVINNFSQIKEMENIKESSRCCGSGGGVKSAFPEIAKSIAIERGKEAEDTGANILVTSCPFCKLNLDENSSMKVLDLSEFVLKQLEIEISNNNKTKISKQGKIEISNNNKTKI